MTSKIDDRKVLSVLVVCDLPAIFELQDAALYQALHRMERAGWIESEWGVSDKGRRAKFYQLTAAGRKRLNTETAGWIRSARAVFAALEAPANPLPTRA